MCLTIVVIYRASLLSLSPPCQLSQQVLILRTDCLSIYGPIRTTTTTTTSKLLLIPSIRCVGPIAMHAMHLISL